MGRCLGRLVKVGIYQRKHDKKGHLMGDEWKGKPLGEFTDDDRAAFMAAIDESTTPAERAALRDFAMSMRNLAEFAQSDEAKEMGEQVGVLLQAAREVATSLKDELDKDTDLARELQGMSLDEALESGKLDELFSRIGEGEHKTKRTQAAEQGALMSIGGRLAAYSSDALKDVLTSNHIMRLPSTVKDPTKAFDERTGQLNPLALGDESLEAITNVHAAFLMGVVAMVEDTEVYDDETTSDLTFYVPKMLDELGIDPRPFSKKRDHMATAELSEAKRAELAANQRYEKMYSLIAPFDSLVGIMPNGSIYRLLAFESYDAETETMTITTPYLFTLKRHAQRLKGPQLHRYLHGSVANEPNHAAVELASRIIGGVVRRGNTAYKTGDEDTKPVVEYRVKYQTLIDDCPMLSAELAAIEADRNSKNKAQRYNTKLRHAFEAAFRIIAEKSELPQRCTDLKLPTTKKVVTVRRGGKPVKVRKEVYVVPTKSVLNRTMSITHRGLKRR